MASTTLKIRNMNCVQQKLAYQIIASTYNTEYSKAKRQRDDECDFDRDVSYVLDSACIIDADHFKSKKLRIHETFGEKKITVDNSSLYMTHERKYVGKNAIDGVVVVETDFRPHKKTFISKCEMMSPSPKDDCGNDEMVTIKIKTGKGGLASYLVPKSEAGDMLG
jgi:hypothetical protein